MTNTQAVEPLIDSNYRLSDNFDATRGRVFLNGTQALVRLLVEQRRLDQARGLNTGGFVSGYRGSPLAGLDFELWREKKRLDEGGIRFVPGVNEDLAATAVMGSQHAGIDPNRNVDGVFAMWYGKGPGVDRAGDALRHGHAAGASKAGGVLMIVGDDHAATSSSIPNASDLSLMGWNIPIVHPAGVDEYIEFGLWGWAASRFSGNWVAFKAISETVESGRSVSLETPAAWIEPDDFVSTVGSLEFKTSDFLTQAIELRLAEKQRALSAFAAVNSIDKLVIDSDKAIVGVVTVGKAHHDVMEAFARAGLSPHDLAALGVRIYKPGLVFPLDESRLCRFAHALSHVLVVEEKGSVVEQQIKELLFNRPGAERPEVVGKNDWKGDPLIAWVGQLRPAQLVPPLLAWLGHALGRSFDTQREQAHAAAPSIDGAALRRLPYFCSGCPHSTSTKVPESSVALAGVGCHYMASWMDRSTSGLTQMGGEGADWVGWAPFTNTSHVFQNMGEGTYFHSGLLAIRQAIAARARITYKLLFNDAVAMTGGQPVDGVLTVGQICAQLLAEGARQVIVTTDDTNRYRGVSLPAGVPVHHRRELDRLQRELRELDGVTVLIHDQTCAAEKRRRRKKAMYPDPPRRLFINEAVCEACGDCGVQSNCVSIVPNPTRFGTKRRIDQSSCNKDYSCAEGFCPSFVSVLGGRPRRASGDGSDHLRRLLDRAATLSEPTIDMLPVPRNILIAGVGGTGVITIGAVLCMAAHLEGKATSLLDFTALAQKGGSVLSHVRIADGATRLGPVRIDWRQADTLIACDLVVATTADAIGTIRHGHTRVVANRTVASLAEFTRDGEAVADAQRLAARLAIAAGKTQLQLFDAGELAVSLFGDSIAANMMMLGMAWQLGRIPVSATALRRAIELNGVAVEMNQRAFTAGRVLAADPSSAPGKAVADSALTATQVIRVLERESLANVLATRIEFLTRYQDAHYAQAYTAEIDSLKRRIESQLPSRDASRLIEVIARNLFKLLSYKDEYEVARLHTSTEFRQALQAQFEGDYRLQFHLAPPALARRHPSTGKPMKMAFGQGVLPVFKVLASLRRLRGTPLDVFGWSGERRRERRLIETYRRALEQMLAQLSSDRLPTALEIARLPDSVRGYGHIKAAAMDKFDRRLAELLESYRHGDRRPALATPVELV